MQGIARSLFAGIVSGTATFHVSVFALGYTNALTMPAWAPLAAWEAIVVLGAGAALVSLAFHFLALLLFRAHAKASWALASFFATTLAAMAFAGLLDHGAKTLGAWLTGAFLASLVAGRLRPDASTRAAPLRGAA